MWSMVESLESRQLLAGVARVIITPPLGIRMMGYTVQECVAEAVERELTATALVLSSGPLTVGLISCDLLFLQSPFVDQLRARIAAQSQIPFDHLLMHGSHTHLGPMLPGWQPGDSPEQGSLQSAYAQSLQNSLVEVVAKAKADLRPARIGAGKGEAPIGMNRRERLADGRVIIGENPRGAVDREVGVIRIDDSGGRPIATLMTAAAHPIVLGPKTPLLSPDYVGPAREIVERATGALSLFFQGAAGNVCPATGIGAGDAEQFDDMQRIGMMLAGEVLKVHSEVRTHHRRGPRSVVQSVAALSTWDYEPLPLLPPRPFALATRTRTLPMAPLPERRSIELLLQQYREQFAAAQAVGARQVARRLTQWAELVLSAIDAAQPVTRDLRCWALRIDDIGIVAVNGEPFAELAIEIKRRSQLQTFFFGYSNGCLGYFPTPEAFQEGGMEVFESYQNYLLPAQFTPAWGPAVVDTALELLDETSRPET